MSERLNRVVIVGGGPGGYEAALVAAGIGAQVTLVECAGVGGAAVLTDCVPSKSLVAAGGYLGRLVESAASMGVHYAAEIAQEIADDPDVDRAGIDLAEVNDRIVGLAAAQSGDIRAGLEAAGVRILEGRGRLASESSVTVELAEGGTQTLDADMILVATGATPRVLPSAVPDGERILTWQQIWSLRDIPPRLIVIGSGVTGAELAQAYLNLGSEVVLVSSRDRVLPHEDPDGAELIEGVFLDRGMEVMNRSRAERVERTDDGVRVVLTDGREVTGTHALLAVGSVPLSTDLGLEEVGVETTPSGHIEVDRVSRTSVRGVYAAGDCTGVLPLASVAATQGRTAVAHALGDVVTPLNLEGISANIFTDPEIATVGMTQKQADARDDVREIRMSLATNARAKMEHLTAGFVKLFAAKGGHVMLGAVVVAPRASELIFPIALAVHHRLTVEQVAETMTVYPSLSGSIAEAARRLHVETPSPTS